jgi:hypothetical protein
VVKNEKINEIERTRVCSPPRATSFKKTYFFQDWYESFLFICNCALSNAAEVQLEAAACHALHSAMQVKSRPQLFPRISGNS